MCWPNISNILIWAELRATTYITLLNNTHGCILFNFSMIYDLWKIIEIAFFWIWVSMVATERNIHFPKRWIAILPISSVIQSRKVSTKSVCQIYYILWYWIFVELRKMGNRSSCYAKVDWNLAWLGCDFPQNAFLWLLYVWGRTTATGVIRKGKTSKRFYIRVQTYCMHFLIL